MGIGLNRDYFIFGGVSSRDYFMTIAEPSVFNKPGRDVEQIEVPGRNGDLIIDNHRFTNVEVTYTGQITREFIRRYDAMVDKLCSMKGYQRLEDSIHPELFRMARFEGGTQPNLLRMFSAGKFEVKFNAKPQRYLKTGELPITFASNGKIINPTEYEAQPLLRVYGVGALGIGSETITISQADEYTDIDCEMQDAFKGAANCNGNIELSSGNFPTIMSGGSGISLGSGITKVIVWPRWWRL